MWTISDPNLVITEQVKFDEDVPQSTDMPVKPKQKAQADTDAQHIGKKDTETKQPTALASTPSKKRSK